MKTQVNIFNKGINSDLSPMYMAGDVWAFPTINARIYNTGSGFAMTNLPGNTNENMLDQKGAEILLKERYSLIGAWSTGGVAFLCSVNIDENKLEIGCFPSPTGSGFQRVYEPLHNINGIDSNCNFSNSDTFNWHTGHLLRIVGKVEYDNSVNLYICSGHDLLRVINSAFDVTTGDLLPHRKYNRNGFEEATRNIATPNKDTSMKKLTLDDITIDDQGSLQYGTYIFYIRYANGTYDKTNWIYETPPITIADNMGSYPEYGYIQGDIGEKLVGEITNKVNSDRRVIIHLDVTEAYERIEVGYLLMTGNNHFNQIEEAGILADQFIINEGESRIQISIPTINASITEEWTGEDNPKTIEMVPGDIWAMNNILYQANMSNELIDKNVIREFFKRVKLKCSIKHGELPMPTDEVARDFNMDGVPKIRRIEISNNVNYWEVSRIFATEDNKKNRFFNYYSWDEIILNEETETTGTIKIMFVDNDLVIDINGEYDYTRTLVDLGGGFYQYSYTIPNTDLDDFTVTSDVEGEAFTLKRTSTSISYLYKKVNTYGKEYPRVKIGSEVITPADRVEIWDEDTVKVDITDTANGIEISDLFFFWNKYNAIQDGADDIAKWTRSYSLVTTAFNPKPGLKSITMKIDYNEITITIQKEDENIFTYKFGENKTWLVQNDGYYANQKHIIEDVGYFGGEIYAFSLLATDEYGNKYGPFPCTGIDHYYANCLSDLEYIAYEEEEGIYKEKLTDDAISSYSTNPNQRKFTKNQQGVYRFPCRANYIKELHTNGKLKNEEDLSSNIDDYNNDIFNLTQRIKVGNNFSNIINIFKIELDFQEAYDWLAQADPITGIETNPNKLIQFRRHLPTITILRAERTADAENLIAQGIIQKPNTVIPFPKFSTWETLDLDSNQGKGRSPGYSHNSFEKLISYNFETIINNCTKHDSEWEENPEDATYDPPIRLNLHGQLGNSSIKTYDAESQNRTDVIYPDALRTLNTIWRMPFIKSKSFIYSGKYQFHDVDFKWDGFNSYKDGEIKFAYATQIVKVPPALGAISFGSYSGSVDTDARMYFKNNKDWIWGEMGSQQIWTPRPTFNEKNMYPQQNIFVDAFKLRLRNQFYDYNVSDAGDKLINKYRGQYLGYDQYPLSVSGGAIKIPFFKGYMPCVHRTGRVHEGGVNSYAITRFYTTRCMYHPYDLTRAFFSVDLRFNMNNENTNLNEIKFIKPLRKTIYSGLDGVVNNNDIDETTDITKSYFKADCWKTFFARPNQMDFHTIPISRNYFNGQHLSEERKYWDQLNSINEYCAPFLDEISKFYAPISIADSGMNTGQNPGSLLHSVRKYFKIESQRECIPINQAAYIKNRNPSNFNVSVQQSGLQEIDADKRNIGYYINHAYDYGLNQGVEGPNNLNTETSESGQKAKHVWDRTTRDLRPNCLWATMDLEGGDAKQFDYGSFFASNRSFLMTSFIALELDDSYTPNLEFPSLGLPDTDYRKMYDYTNNFYDRTVRLSQMSDDPKSPYHVKIKHTGQLVDSLETREDSKTQYTSKDIYIDYNYEDLSLVNLYKVDPENIIDITNYYLISSQLYYAIEQVNVKDILGYSNSIDPKRKVVVGRGDCYLDRIHFKHTSWLPTNIGFGPSNIGTDDYGKRYPSTNWEMTGSATATNNWSAVFTSATSSYAHGVTLGLITENKYNIALRGKIDTENINAYPMCSNMPNSDNLAGALRARKNRFLIYPNAKTENNNYSEALQYNQGYNKTLGSIPYGLENSQISFLANNFPNRIRWSYYASKGAIVDPWRNFDIKDYQDYDAQYGGIKRIMDINGTLISFMPDGILQHHYEGTDVKIGPDDRQILSVGGMKILSRDTNLLSDVGLSHKFGLVKTSKGIYGINTEKNSIWNVGSQVDEHGRTQLGASPLSKSAGIHNWTKEYIQDIRSAENLPIDVTNASTKIPDTIYDGLGITAAFDSEHNEVLFTFVNRFKSYTLCYSEMIEKFVSLYTFAPYMYFNINDNFYSVKHSQRNGNEARHIYRHNNEYSHKQKFYGSFYKNDFALSIISNGIAGEDNLSIFAKQFQAQVIESQQEPFTTVRYETQDQVAEHPFIDTENWWSVPEYLSHHWQVPIQLDNISGDDDEDMFYGDSSMLGGWLKTTLTYTADSRNKDIHIQSILTSFNISQS